jgi:hypothetical protein
VRSSSALAPTSAYCCPFFASTYAGSHLLLLLVRPPESGWFGSASSSRSQRTVARSEGEMSGFASMISASSGGGAMACLQVSSPRRSGTAPPCT